MALINCPECSHQVSELAPSCPNCGAPIAKILNPEKENPDGEKTTTIQETSKKLKVQIIISLAAVILGIFMLFFNAADSNSSIQSFRYSNLLITFGIIGYIVTKMRIWWHHK